jgi:Ca-activated chloride channel homolog
MMRKLGGFLAALVLLTASASARKPDDDDRRRRPILQAPKFRMAAPSAAMGATPGGAQDIDYARDRIRAGEVPHANTFTAEGLLSQHDLPLDSKRQCSQILCLAGAAARSDLIAQPEVRYLAQLGFASNLDPKTWKRAPLNLVAVVDKSGSMSGRPIDMVKASLRHITRQMKDGDQLSIVLYGDRAHVHLEPTSLKQRQRVLSAIERIEIAGSTAMEEGLRVGFELARQSKPKFAGVTRVMLFTDERPNVGRTDKESFIGMAREASARGVGMTTIGVSTHFGAELATAVSSVRGGNLFFFPDAPKMADRFQRDFDTMVTELAYDLKLVVKPSPGYKLVGLYGLPGDRVKRTADGGLQMTIETIFLSRDKGGIFFGFAPAEGSLPPKPGPVGNARIEYTDTQKKREQDQVGFPIMEKDKLPLGLARGTLLIDQVTTLKQASVLHGQQNKTEEAYRMVRALKKRLADSRISGLDKERELVAKLDETLTRLSGHQGESPATGNRDAVSGLPAR